MKVINGQVAIGDCVAFPSKTPNGGLAMQIGMVEEIRPDTGKIKVKPVYSSTYASVNQDGTYASKAVPADVCVIIDRAGHNA